jgi:hypothetical protein
MFRGRVVRRGRNLEPKTYNLEPRTVYPYR